MPELSKIAGFVDAAILSRTTEQGVEFLITTRWQSREAIQQFAGESEDRAVVPAKVQAMMVEYEGKVTHYEIVEEWRGDGKVK